MEEKDRKPEERNEHTKLAWETPKLYALDKGKTEGGATVSSVETAFNDNIASLS